MFDFAATFLKNCDSVCDVLCALIAGKMMRKENKTTANEESYVITSCALQISRHEM